MRTSAPARSSHPVAPDGPYVLVIGKAIALLDAILEGGEDVSLAELGRRVGMSRSTVHRLLATLERHAFVERTVDGDYRLGIHLLELGRVVQERLSLGRIAEPHLVALAESLRTTSYLSVRDGERAVCAERVDRGDVEVSNYRVGETLPLYAGAGPVILLAGLPDDQVDALLREPLAPIRRGVEVSPAQVLERVAGIRSSGVMVAEDDVVEGVVAVGAPVLDPLGRTVAAVSITGLGRRFAGDELERAVDAVRRAAAAVSREVAGYRRG